MTDTTPQQSTTNTDYGYGNNPSPVKEDGICGCDSCNEREEEEEEEKEELICCLCDEEIDGYGNNPRPVKEDGICCDKCNMGVVIPARIYEARRR